MNKFQYKVQGVDYNVEIEELEGNVATVRVNGIKFEVELKQPINPAHAIHKKTEVKHPQPTQSAPVTVPQPQSTDTQSVSVGTGSQVKSPLPGIITSVNVRVGDKVKDGDTVVVLEAMKMQNNIESEFSGTVTSILVKQGDSVLEGAVLLTIA